MNERLRSLDELGRSLATEMLDACAELTFRIFYGLPPHTQVGIAQAMMERYMPVFRSRQAVAVQLEPALTDPADWVARNGRSIPDLDAPNPADNAFYFCFDALLLAAAYPDDPFTLTSSSAAAVEHAVLASRLNVWMADDPVAVGLWTQQLAPPERTFLTNAASRAVALREWSAVWAMLDSSLVLSEPAPPGDEVDRAVARWTELSHLISVPR
jgi:hypothetical protein